MPLDGMLTDEQRVARAKPIQDVLLTQKLSLMLKDRAEELSRSLSMNRESKVVSLWALVLPHGIPVSRPDPP